MPTREEITDALTEFKSAREAVVEADEDEFRHHLAAFVRELDRNFLCAEIIKALPAYDANAWWQRQIEGVGQHARRIETLDLPDDKDQQVQIYLDLVRSFASNEKSQLSVSGFGNAMGKHKTSDAINLSQSLVLRPLTEELTRRLRKAASMANPDIRELAGVPLSRIPNDKELGIFLSHRSTDKPLVDRYCSALKELGLSPWYDKDAIPAGATLHRALEDGMDQSCAALFFITQDFQDERWLRREIDLAIQRQIHRGSKFVIITLVFGSVTVPRSLTTYRYVNVEQDLEGLREIIRALPIEVGPPRWKNSVAG